MMILRLALLWVLCSAWQERMKERPVVRREGKGHPRSDLAQKSLLVTAEGETEMEAQQMAPPPNERAAMIEETEFDESEDVASAPEDERDAPPVEETHPRPEPLMGEADWPEPEPSEEKPGAGDDVEPEDAEVPEAAAPPPAAAPVAAAAPSAARPNATEAAPRPTDAVADENEDDDGPVPGDAPDASPDAATADEAEEIQLTELEEDPQDRNPEALTAEVSIIEETVSEEEPDGTDSPVQSQEEPDLQGEPLTEEEATQQPEDDSKDEDPPAEDIPDPTNETEEEDFAKLFNFIDAEAASLALENAGPERFSQEALQAVLAEEVEGEEEESFEESSASDEKDEKDEKDSEDEKEDSGGEEEEEHAEAEVPESLEEDVVVATECKLEKEWCEAFSKAGFSAADIAQLTHKDGEWFYKGKSTKVGMAPPCDPHKDICAGGKEGFGNPVQQAAALKEAIQNGGIHPEMAHPCKLGEYWCPLMKKTGLSAPDIQKVTVANAEWQYDGEPLRVGYGQHSKACPAAQVYCAGGAVFGTGQSQANAVRDAIQNGGIHPAKANYKAFQNVCVLDGEKAATKDAGHAWKNLVECEQLCDMKAGCTGFEWYAKGLNLKTCFLFVNQALAGASTGQRVQDAECFIKKERRCIQFPNWRKKWLGSHVTISLGKHRFGANVGSWSTCLDLCESQKECKQVVFFRGRCFGMLARSDEDQSGKGGKNKGFISAHCYDKDVLHWVSNCNECGKQLCGHYARNENHLEGSFMMGSPLSTWGCSNLYTKPFTTVRSSSKRVYVVENEAEQASACPFLTPHSRPHQVLCEDGVYVKDYGCMKNEHGQRAKCPPNLPMMCAQQTCGPDKKDYCCKSSCKDFGGPRECSQAVTYYKNNMALSWSKFKEKCESRGKRLCTFTEVCHKQGLRPIGGLQSKSDAWCPIVEDDFQSPNYVEVGAVNVHPTCKKMTDDKASSSWTWPMADERRDLKEVYACCEGWSPRGIRWRNRPLTWRFQSPKDALTAHFGRRWACGEVSYQQLPKYLASAFPMKGTRDVNTADRNELVLPLPTLVFLLRSDRWRKVGLEGWTDTGNVGSYLGKVYPNQIRIYWKILEAGKHIIDNNSGMYLFTDPKRLAGCLGTAGATANPVGFMAPESFPQQPPRSAEELWAYNRQGAYGKKVQGMKFAAITLKENAENGGDYEILFGNVPPSDAALPDSDCAASAGVAFAAGARPGAKVRASGGLVATWKGTTWKVYMARDPWPSFGSLNTKCQELEKAVPVADRSECQWKAVLAGHSYYQFLTRSNQAALCGTSSTCNSPATGLAESWEVFSKNGPYFSYGPDTSCKAPESLVYTGPGFCANGQVFSSSAWALAESKYSTQQFQTDQYKAWMKTAWANCLAKDADVTHVSVWVDAGYRCYKTLDCRPNGAGNVQTFSGAALGKAFVHLRSQGGAVGKSYLGTNVHGTVTFLAPQDDQSGLQRWVLRKGAGEWYTIRVWEGTKGRFFLSSSGSKAILVASDDGSGLQRWSITKRPGGYFNIQDSSAKKFLSWSASGAIELSDADDGSGRQRWLIGFEADAAVLTAWAEKNFAKYGNTNLPANRVVTTRLSSGDVVTLKGFTHTRDYARGFLRNAPGTATATVIGLEPGALYVWRVYQSARLVAGVNAMKVNNIFEAEQIVSSNTFTPRKRGMTAADSGGRLIFTFIRHSLHVQLSGLAVKRYDEAVDEHLSTWEENNFNNRGQSNLQWTATYTYYLHNGYRCDLSGWTHTRTYAHGFLRNRPGWAKAVVSGLVPGAEYAWKVYSTTTANVWKHARVNRLSVNGDQKGWWYTMKAPSFAPARIGMTQASGDGKITFLFYRHSHHIHFSGLAVARLHRRPVVHAPQPSLAACKETCASMGASCTGFEFTANQCAFWSTPIAGARKTTGSECVAVTPEHVYGVRHTGKGGDGKRFSRGPGGLLGTEVPNGEANYQTGPYELLKAQSRSHCQAECSERGWCVGYGYKFGRSIGSGPNWQLNACHLVDRLAAGATGITEFTSYSKVGAWVDHGLGRRCGLEAKLILQGQGYCTTGQIYSSRAWALSSSTEGRKGFKSGEYSSWVQTAWQRCKALNAQTSHVSVWTDAGFRCYVGSCKVQELTNVRSYGEVSHEKLSTLKEQSFYKKFPKQVTLNVHKTYHFKLQNGYSVALTGWTHTRTYALGFLRTATGPATAVVSGLEPGASYVWKFYQYNNHPIVYGWNNLWANNIYQGKTYQGKSMNPAALGMSTADANGRIEFKFAKVSARFVHLSHLAIRKLREAKMEALPPLSKQTFLPHPHPNRNLNEKMGYIHMLSNGYVVELKGWTHTRTYAKGFLRNKPGAAWANVYGLEPGKLYAFKIYQFAHGRWGPGWNPLKVNGKSLGRTFTGQTSTKATKSGATRANEEGKIRFQFIRQSPHVHLSSISLARVEEEEGDGYLSTLQENSFNDWPNANLNPKHGYHYMLSGGFRCVLSGWTHVRSYAMGVLRNRPGSGRALVVDLKPNKLYTFRIYQFASAAPGKNGLKVNGGQMVTTVQGKSTAPTFEGMARSNAKGQLIFDFFRQSHHVHLSGIAIGALHETVPQAAVQVLAGQTLDECKRGCETRGGCRGVEYDAAKKRCDLWSSAVGTTNAEPSKQCLSWHKN